MKIDPKEFNTLSFHAYANRLEAEASNLMLKYVPKEAIKDNEMLVGVYTTTVSSFLALIESLGELKEAVGENNGYYKAIIATVKDVVDDLE